jgi:hypothetical protein
VEEVNDDLCLFLSSECWLPAVLRSSDAGTTVIENPIVPVCFEVCIKAISTASPKAGQSAEYGIITRLYKAFLAFDFD